ncbi:hypothetical protein BROUX41_000710 [Berkeleyomyces rouxiae]|uniref:uncharacterized protein n=1 Tax=Berkeleyomyces rouxiae TaxID=2035830 RepID=UPI003B7D3CF1
MPSSSSSSSQRTTILKGLNRQQHRAVSSRADTVAILAGPGCGKTHTLTSRVAFLVEEMGYQPWNIIVATFTVKAAREMRERIGKHLGEKQQRKLILGTFHSIAVRYLRFYGHLIGLPKKFGIMDDTDCRSIVKRIFQRLGIEDVQPRDILSFISKEKSKSPYFSEEEHAEAPSTQSRVNSQGITVKKPPKPPTYIKVYEEYQAHLKATDTLDFDDLLIRCVELLQQHPHCVANIEAVLIDEYQDTNGMQYELLKLFASAKKRVTVVGDPDQSIYGWRAAEIRNLQRLLAEFPGTEEVALEENYRSSTQIIDTAVQVIKQDTKRYDKVLAPVHGKGTRPTLRRLATAKDQADWIAMEIRRVIDMTAKTLKWDDIAILLRSSSSSRLIESSLTNQRIKYRMVGGRKFYERAEIKIVVDYLRAINQPKHNDVVSRILNVPKRGFGAKTIIDLLREAERFTIPLWDMLLQHVRGERKSSVKFNKTQEQELYKLIGIINNGRTRLRLGAEGKPFDLVKLLDYLIKTLQLQGYLKATYKEDHETRWENVEEFVKNVREFVESSMTEDETLPENEGVHQQKHMDMLDRFLTNVALTSEPQEGRKDDGAQDGNLGQVTISTIHAAKGLEWPVVFVPNVSSGSIPNSRTDDIDEERRLLYVAMTRAKALLYLSFPARDKLWSGEWAQCEISCFLSATQKMFAPRGPSFTRDALDIIGQILGRDVPSVDYVYKNLPEMAITEDDHYPEVPPTKRPDSELEGLENGQDGRSKRPRVKLQSGGIPDPNANWNTEYSTTMQQSANFTVGFVSASSHHATLGTQSTGKVNGAENKNPYPRSVKQSGSRNLMDMGFKGTRGTGTNLSSVHADTAQNLASSARPRSITNTVSRSGPNSASTSYLPPARSTTINSQLTKHSLGAGRGAIRPCNSAAPNPKASNSLTSPEKFTQQKGVYPQFSSSPMRPDNDNKQQRPGISSVDVKADDDDDEVIIIDKPAQTMHSTTMTTTFGGFHRPTQINRLSGPQQINRISKLNRPPVTSGNKPFKKLTIVKRNGL